MPHQGHLCFLKDVLLWYGLYADVLGDNLKAVAIVECVVYAG